MHAVSLRITQTNFSPQSAAAAVLKNGSVVTGRVISKNPDGSYSVSLAGQKLNVQSETNLLSGQVFSAKVNLNENQIFLSLVKNLPDVKNSNLLQNLSPDGKNLSPQLSEFLLSLGFEPTADSLKIFQFMQQVGMKIDVESAKKALQNAKKEGKNSEDEAQVSLLLSKKGIKSAEERVNVVLGRQNQNQGGRDRQNRKKKEKLEISNEKLAMSNRDLGDDFSQGKFLRDDDFFWNGEFVRGNLQNELKSEVKKYFSELDSASLSRENGILSAFNTVLSKKNDSLPLRHWLLFPFEWNFQESAGTIRLLFDSGLENLEKVVVDIKSGIESSGKSGKERIFALDFKNKKVESVRFASNCGSKFSKSAEENLLSSLLGNSVRAERVDFDSLRGFCPSDEKISLVSGEA